jgi:hypothetical protein
MTGPSPSNCVGVEAIDLLVEVADLELGLESAASLESGTATVEERAASEDEATVVEDLRTGSRKPR